jgi:hypothetical protein
VSSRQLIRCLPFAAVVLVAACAEQLNTSDNCPALCAPNALEFRDTLLDIVQFDSAFGGFTGEGERFPAPGLPSGTVETFVSVATRGDSLDVRQVFRFDSLPRTRSVTDTTPITALQASRFLFVLDSTRSVLPPGNMTVNLYDVDDSTVANDTSVALLAARFTPQRLIASRTFTREQVYADTINTSGFRLPVRAFTIPISDSILLRYVKVAKRLRVGMQLVSAQGAALRLVAPRTLSPGLVPRLTYDPSPDTAIVPIEVATQYGSPPSSATQQFRAQALVLRDNTTLLNDGTLQAGGLTGVRSLLQVRLPRAFLDTVTIIRATLDVVMRPQPTVPGATVSVPIRPRITIAGPSLQTDVRRFVEVLDPTIEGALLPALRIAPADTGVKSFNVGNALRFWLQADTTRLTGFVLYSEGEVFQEQRPAFYSRRDPNPARRPRLRVTYTPRREGAIP